MFNATLLGNLGKDPESKIIPGYGDSELKVCNFSVATRNRDGSTTWVACSAWGKTADLIANSFRSGSKICVAGEIENVAWTSKDGDKTGYNLTCKVSKFDYVDPKSDDGDLDDIDF